MDTMETNEEICGHHEDANGTDESGIISDLSSTTEVQTAEVDLKAEIKEFNVKAEIKEVEVKVEIKELDINQQQLNERSQRNENVRIADQNYELMKILFRKDKTIENMSTVINHMETQLQSAVSAKLDALARLTIQGKELTLNFKEKQMDLDAERVSNNIENLTDNFNKTVTELMAARQELVSASAQFEIEMKQKSVEIRMTNLKVCELSATNQVLKTQNEEYAYKLQQQLNESGKLMELYEMELNANSIQLIIFIEM